MLSRSVQEICSLSPPRNYTLYVQLIHVIRFLDIRKYSPFLSTVPNLLRPQANALDRHNRERVDVK